MEDLPVTQLLSVDQAIAILDAVPLRPRLVHLPLMEAVGFRLAEDIFSDRDYPPFDKAVMDGYALRAGDAAEPGARLRVIETIAAGQTSQRKIAAGEAVKIMTGAPLPAGADAVVPVEHTTRDGEFVRLERPIKPGNAVAVRGTDTVANRLLLSKGTRLGPAQVGVAASVGKSIVSVCAAPEVCVLTTGDEIIEMDQPPTGSQIRNSNGPMMIALLQQLGCRVVDLAIVRDEPVKIRAAIETGLNSDAVFITGGMSMGEHDYVPMLLRDLGMDLKISKLRIKPGKPFVFATRDRAGGGQGGQRVTPRWCSACRGIRSVRMSARCGWRVGLSAGWRGERPIRRFAGAVWLVICPPMDRASFICQRLKMRRPSDRCRPMGRRICLPSQLQTHSSFAGRMRKKRPRVLRWKRSDCCRN